MDSSKEILIALGELKGLTQGILSNQAVTTNRLDKHDAEIGNLQKWKAWILGASFAASAFVTGIFQVLTHKQQ